MISMLIYSCKQDEIELLQEISRDVVAYYSEERLEIVTYTEASAIQYEEIESVDVAYVDITDGEGLQIAKDIRQWYPMVEIMIISDNSISPMAYLTPDVRASSLLLKPLEYGMVNNSIRDLFRAWKPKEFTREDIFTFSEEGEQRRIPYSQILYLEARNRRVYIRVQNNEYGIFSVLESLEESLPDYFKRCHRSFIVNTSYISKVWFSKNYIVLNNDEELPLSRSYKSVIKEVVKGEE